MSALPGHNRFLALCSPADASTPMADTDPPVTPAARLPFLSSTHAAPAPCRPAARRADADDMQVRTLTLFALLVVVGSWYGMHRARVGRARRYGREATERWEAEGGAPLPDSDRGD